jgi:hypothetical protein
VFSFSAQAATGGEDPLTEGSENFASTRLEGCCGERDSFIELGSGFLRVCAESALILCGSGSIVKVDRAANWSPEFDGFTGSIERSVVS